MIPQIKEINFPEYATLSTATATLVDMGDKTITAQVKIDGPIVPDFSYDWEIEFQGERYIQPLREPQANKSNESISSVIDLTFYHKGIYDLKRYFFVSTVELEAETLMADNYVVPLRLNIAEFVIYLNNVLKYYYGDTYKVFLNPDYKYEETDRKDIDINYTKIWDVITKMYEWFGVRWAWETQQDDIEYYSIKIGYPSAEVSHVFEYGFESGLLKFERQVQNPEIANMVLGRGSSENIPYRYFKDKDPNNPSFPADPDWVPELANTHFANLRGKTFRDYVKGWKAKHYNGNPIYEAYQTEAYKRGYNDIKFNPIEYVEDKESIAKYGEIQKGLEHNEEIKPTIQGISIDGIGRVDEVVDVEPILVDESTSNTEAVVDIEPISEDIVTSYKSAPSNDALDITVTTKVISISNIKDAHIVKDTDIEIVQHVRCVEEFSKYDAVNNQWHILSRKTIQKVNPLKINSIEVSYINNATGEGVADIANIEKGTTFYIVITANVSGFVKKQTNIPHPNPNFSAYTGTLTPDATFEIITSVNTEIDYTPIHGQIIGNYENGTTRKSRSVTISANGIGHVVFTTEQFTITEENAPATSVDMPYRITSSLDSGEYNPLPNVVAINADTNEPMTSLNLPAGTYYLQNSIQISNFSNKSQTFKVELLPTYIYYSYDSASWKPTFDIWVKNIWQTEKGIKEREEGYANRVWTPILGDANGQEAKVVFSSGWLSGHSDWEFAIARMPVYDDTKEINGVKSHWRITLYKSDAELEAIDKYIPSIQTQAHAGDHFYFLGIDVPRQYVLWAEERLDEYKRGQLDDIANVKSTIVVQLDKVRVSQAQEGDISPLIDSLRVGNIIKVKDPRFTLSDIEALSLQNITYTWDESTTMLPNIQVVLSDTINQTISPFRVVEDNIKNIKNETSLRLDNIEKRLSANNRVFKRQVTTIKDDVKGNSSWIDNFHDLPVSQFPAQVHLTSQLRNESYAIELSNIRRIRSAVRLETNGYADKVQLRDSNGVPLYDKNGVALYAASLTPQAYKDFTSAADRYEELLIKRMSTNTPLTNEELAEFNQAQSKVYEQMAKIEAENIEANNLSFLRNIFGAGSILNSYAAILSSLIAVQSTEGNVRAGMYGGGVASLDEVGYKHDAYGTLMMFAGAKSASEANKSVFRVYENGTTYTGVLRKSATYINGSNVTDYSYEEGDYRVISFEKCSSYIVMSFEKNDSTDKISLTLPYSTDARNNESLFELVGTTVVVMDDSAYEDNQPRVCFKIPLVDSGDFGMSQCPAWALGVPKSFMCVCRSKVTNEGTIPMIGWVEI